MIAFPAGLKPQQPARVIFRPSLQVGHVGRGTLVRLQEQFSAETKLEAIREEGDSDSGIPQQIIDSVWKLTSCRSTWPLATGSVWWLVCGPLFLLPDSNREGRRLVDNHPEGSRLT